MASWPSSLIERGKKLRVHRGAMISKEKVVFVVCGLCGSVNHVLIEDPPGPAPHILFFFF